MPTGSQRTRGAEDGAVRGGASVFRPLGDFTVDPRRLLYLATLALGIGGLSGLVALVLLRLIGLITNLAYFGCWSTTLVAPAGHGWIMVAIPVAGGLAVGLLAKYGTEKIRGHGIPEAIQAILENKSRMEPRVALVKPIASAITIGTGGPFGAEGPIIVTGGAVASLIGQLLLITAAERRTLLVAGAAGGMSATFGAPISSVLLAVELLLFEWKPASLIPVTVASVAAYAVRVLMIGSTPIFQSPVSPPSPLPWLVAAALLGGLAGVVSGAITKSVYLVEDWYRRLPIHWVWWPAIGGVAVGLGGLLVPQALGVGYPTIRALDAGSVLVTLALALLVVKFIIWVVALSSGTSGGVLAPLLLMGGALGTALSPILPGHQPGLWATVAMAALLGATMRAPFTATIFAMETTHNWTAVGPVFLATVMGTLVTVLWVRRSILTEKVARRGTHVAREYAVDVLEGAPLARLMTPRDRTPTLPLACTVGQAVGHLVDDTPAWVVLDSHGQPSGVVGWRGLCDLAHDPETADQPVARYMCAVPSIGVARRAREAAVVMGRTGSAVLLVVNPDGTLAGLMTPDNFLAAWSAAAADEEQLEQGLLVPPESPARGAAASPPSPRARN